MPFTLSVKEQETLAIVLREMPDMPDVDWKVVAPKMGQKYARNARSAFKKIWSKLKGEDGGEIAQKGGHGKEEDEDGEDGEGDAAKAKGKVNSSKKNVGQRNAPAKAQSAGRQGKKSLTKKERAAAMQAEAEMKAEAGDDADVEGDTDMTGAANMGNSKKKKKGVSNVQRSRGASYEESQDGDAAAAALLGMSVEKFKQEAEETFGGYAPTPGGHIDSEDEV